MTNKTRPPMASSWWTVLNGLGTLGASDLWGSVEDWMKQMRSVLKPIPAD